MGDANILIKAKIHYYGREKYFHQMQVAAVDGIKRFAGDQTYKFFYAMALVLEGRLQEGIRELDPLQSYSDVMLGALIGLIHAHKLCLTVDKEAVAAFDAKLKDERKKADDQALYFAGLFLLYVEKADKAREYVDRLLKINPNSVDGLNLKGWVELANIKENRTNNKAALQYFETVLQKPGGNRNVEALFGKAKYYEVSGHMDKANEILSTLVVVFNYTNEFAPPLIEKMKVELSVQDWDQADDTANRVCIFLCNLFGGKDGLVVQRTRVDLVRKEGCSLCNDCRLTTVPKVAQSGIERAKVKIFTEKEVRSRIPESSVRIVVGVLASVHDPAVISLEMISNSVPIYRHFVSSQLQAFPKITFPDSSANCLTYESHFIKHASSHCLDGTVRVVSLSLTLALSHFVYCP